MAGSSPDFDADAFRTAINSVYDMAAPTDVNDRALFCFPSQLVYNEGTPVDANGVAFDPASTVTRVTPAPVRVPCAIEYFDAQGSLTNFGVITPTRLQITMLDAAYAKVKDCSFVVVGGDKYLYRRTQPPSGLFDVGIYTMHFAAENET